ncbi:MAG: hypothetical protein A2583_01585 [Bdellovibrionales bacterium RIFOXYD1_FULL_53_11]|nr:MAG: hypothetical protein A2583_01585 [Bdellovibrionales bacterium RIFOXYD1_FULL_53_11]
MTMASTLKIFLPLFVIFSLSAALAAAPLAAPTAVPAPAEPGLERIENTTLYFKGGPPEIKPLDTKLQELKFFAFLRTPDKKIWYALVSGRPCTDCIQEKHLYLIRSDRGKVTQLVYPGRILEPKTRQVVYDSRAFFGRCMPPADEEVYIVFQKERVDRRRSLQASVLVAMPGTDMIHEKLIERRLPNINHTLARVKRKQCWEIEGRNRLILAKPLDLNPRRGMADNDKDDDDENDEKKETQAQKDMPSQQE